VKDKAMNKAYRERFGSCYRQYSLAVPFMERFFDLAVYGDGTTQAGYVGMITANSFMKREFGKKLIQQYIPRWDITHVVDTSGAYIPGHGTPTVILFARHRKPVTDIVRAVMGIKGEPGTPENPAKGLVWSAILKLVNQPGADSEFVSAGDSTRAKFHKHPWSIGGGGAGELKHTIDEVADMKLGEIATNIGFIAITGEDSLYLYTDTVQLKRFSLELIRPLIMGDKVRDWSIAPPDISIWLYDKDFCLHSVRDLPNIFERLWTYKTVISYRKRFGIPMVEQGFTWYEWRELYVDKLKTPLSIALAEITSHNHFVMDRGGKLFSRTAPVIKLSPSASEDEHLQLLGVLNSSVSLFWGRQTLFPKGGFAAGKWEDRLVWNASNLVNFPVSSQKPLALPKQLDALGRQLAETLPTELIRKQTPTAPILDSAQKQSMEIREQMIALQEELDWQCYKFYGITNEELWLPDHTNVPRIKLGERAFEIVMARKMAAGKLETTWFKRHGSTPITEIPSHWPEEYQLLIQKRIDLIGDSRSIRLIEQPEHKRRWVTEPWEAQQERALKEWLLNRIEFVLSGRDLMAEDDPREATRPPQLISCAELADKLRDDKDFMQVADLYQNHTEFNLTELVTELATPESVPFLPFLRFKPAGLRKHAEWKKVWDMQREEDATDARTELPEDDPQYLTQEQAAEIKAKEIGEIPVPPKYKSADFLNKHYWRLRGKLDVPKERFVSYPLCERGIDPTPVITWAGWNHLQQAMALAEYYANRQDEGWSENRRMPMLAGLSELIPWLRQWHNEIDPTYGERMGDYFAAFISEEIRSIGKDLKDLENWKP